MLVNIVQEIVSGSSSSSSSVKVHVVAVQIQHLYLGEKDWEVLIEIHDQE